RSARPGGRSHRVPVRGRCVVAVPRHVPCLTSTLPGESWEFSLRESHDSDRFPPPPQPLSVVEDVAPLGVAAWVWSLVALWRGVAISSWLAHGQQRRIAADQRADLYVMADTVTESVRERVRSCELLARSVQTLFLASSEVEPDEFANR